MFHWLLDLTLDGVTHRLAEEDLDVERADGEVLHYVGALEVDAVTESMAMLSSSITAPEVGLRILRDGLDLSPLSMLRAHGELARWREGTVYELRRRIVAGSLQSPEISLEEDVRTTLAAEPWRDTATLIGAEQAVSASTWSITFTSLDGGDDAGATLAAYPVVIGRPGRCVHATSAGDTTSIPAWVAPWLYHSPNAYTDVDGADGYAGVALVLAGHHLQAEQVRLTTETDTVGIDCPVLNTWDELGQPVAVVPYWGRSTETTPTIYLQTFNYFRGAGTVVGLGYIDNAPAYTDDSTQPAIYAALRDGGGGLVDAGREVRSAGEVLAWALSRTASGVDRLRMAEAEAALSPYLVDTVIADADASRPWEWIANTLLPWLPCAVAQGPDGLFVVPVIARPAEADAQVRIDTGVQSDVEISRVRWDTSRLVRSVTVKYRYNVKTNGYTDSAKYGSRAVAASRAAGNAVREHPSFSVQESWAQAAGLSQAQGEDKVLEVAAVYDTGTADLAAYTLASLLGLPVAMVDCTVPEDQVFSALRRGSIVHLVDEDLELDDTGQVVSIQTTGDGTLGLVVQIILDPARVAA